MDTSNPRGHSPINAESYPAPAFRELTMLCDYAADWDANRIYMRGIDHWGNVWAPSIAWNKLDEGCRVEHIVSIDRQTQTNMRHFVSGLMEAYSISFSPDSELIKAKDAEISRLQSLVDSLLAAALRAPAK